MITTATKFKLVVFGLVAAVAAAIVGGKYARIDDMLFDSRFPVLIHFADPGGIFVTAEVTYRGITVGKVTDMEYVPEGVDVTVKLDKGTEISEDATAYVKNKSAAGEQFVDLSPTTTEGPFLKSGSVIEMENTKTPLDVTTLLVHVGGLIRSIDTEKLNNLVEEVGQGFEGSADDLNKIVETATDFVKTADENFGVTQDLIRSAGTVLQTQADKQGQLTTFSKNLALLSDTLVASDADLRKLLDQGSESAKLINDVVKENSSDLSSILADTHVASEPLAEYAKSLLIVPILYPYMVMGSYTVVAPSKLDDGEFDATVGLVLTPYDEMGPCTYEDDGAPYRPKRDGGDLSDVEFNLDNGCSNPDKLARSSDKTVWTNNRAAAAVAAGEDSLSWLLLGPATN